MMLFLTFVMLVAGATAAVPQPHDIQQGSNARIVNGVIRKLIEDFNKDIRDNNLDPLVYEGSEYIFFNENLKVYVEAVIGKFVLEGLSGLKAEYINFNALTGRVTIIVSLSPIRYNLEPTDVLVQIGERQYRAHVSGSGEITGLRVHIELRVTVGIISGVVVRSATVVVTYPEIKSHAIFILGRFNISKLVNNFLEETLPALLLTYSDDINKALSELILNLATQ